MAGLGLGVGVCLRPRLDARPAVARPADRAAPAALRRPPGASGAPCRHRSRRPDTAHAGRPIQAAPAAAAWAARHRSAAARADRGPRTDALAPRRPVVAGGGRRAAGAVLVQSRHAPAARQARLGPGTRLRPRRAARPAAIRAPRLCRRAARAAAHAAPCRAWGAGIRRRKPRYAGGPGRTDPHARRRAACGLGPWRRTRDPGAGFWRQPGAAAGAGLEQSAGQARLHADARRRERRAPGRRGRLRRARHPGLHLQHRRQPARL